MPRLLDAAHEVLGGTGLESGGEGRPFPHLRTAQSASHVGAMRDWRKRRRTAEVEPKTPDMVPECYWRPEAQALRNTFGPRRKA